MSESKVRRSLFENVQVRSNRSTEQSSRTEFVAVGNGPVESATVDALVRSIEDDMAAQGSPVTSDEIGIAVLDRLRKLDPAAYLRFASVYKGFEAAEDFAREIRELAKVRKSDRDPQ